MDFIEAQGLSRDELKDKFLMLNRNIRPGVLSAENNAEFRKNVREVWSAERVATCTHVDICPSIWLSDDMEENTEEDTLYKCTACGSATNVWEIQTRSADESATLYIMPKAIVRENDQKN